MDDGSQANGGPAAHAGWGLPADGAVLHPAAAAANVALEPDEAASFAHCPPRAPRRDRRQCGWAAQAGLTDRPLVQQRLPPA